MNQNLRLGKIRGIEVGVNWSVLLIFLLIAWELADIVLPDDHPHEARALYWTIGLITTAMFFASLLAHEVAHAIVAKRNGIGVRRITLWLFGGVSELEKDALSPGAEFRIADGECTRGPCFGDRLERVVIQINDGTIYVPEDAGL